MVKISELQAGQGNVDVEGTVKEVGEVRTFNKFGRDLSVANAMLEDDSGSIKLSLWNDDATKYKSGDKIKITNGYVSEFQGEKQLTSGKFGKIEMAGEGAGSDSVEDNGAESVKNAEEEIEKTQDTASEIAEADAETPMEEKIDAIEEEKSEGIKEEVF
ncbi:hypothetical protein HOD75_03450 [archaeon]|jgi:replication factor A1|nr:hypothetical protein [archaeon]MBT4241929.1 hypothetical protein [archaeon]MBT4418476.1 hypothetical protein [archaeon]